MNLPNKLTIFRMALTPILVMILIIDSISERFLIAGIVFAIASITDQVDGFIARKYNMVTNFGKLADPLADKLLVVSVLLCFLQLNIITALPVIIIIFREFLIVYVRLIAAGNGEIIAANSWGKLKTVSQIFAILFIFIAMQLNNKNLLAWCEPAVWVSAVFAALSGAVYIKDNIGLIKNKLN